jgi:hypothetical protein
LIKKCSLAAQRYLLSKRDGFSFDFGYCRLGISVEQSRFVRRRNIWHKFVLRLAKCLSQLLVDVMRWVCGVASAYARLFFVEAVTLFDDGICLVEADVGRVTVLRLS